METAIAALIILTVVLFGALTIVQVYLSAQDAILTSWREMEERLGERARTEISADGPGTVDPLGHTVVVTLTNEGSTKLADFDQWDVIVQYYRATGDCIIKWLPYTETAPPGDNQWTKAISEVYEPGIFNPREVMTITLVVIPTVALTTTNRVIIATPNGITASAVFTR